MLRKSVELSTLKRGLDLLGLFSEEEPLLDISLIAERMGLPKSTAYKYVQTLQGSLFLVREKGGRLFELGPRLLELAAIAQNPSKLVDVSYPILQELVAQTNETALLAAIMGDQAVCLSRVESNHSLKLTYELGATHPLHSGASAQVLLAWLDESTQKKLLTSMTLVRFTEMTITSSKELSQRLKQIRKDGFAVSKGELDEGTFAVAAPLLSGSGHVMASLSLGGPIHRFDQKEERQYINLVQKGARKIMELLR